MKDLDGWAAVLNDASHTRAPGIREIETGVSSN
jgi:hypothetical protein